MKELTLCLVLGFLAASGVHSQGRADIGTKKATVTTYKTYYNDRFEYSISYPSKLLFAQPIATNGDGRKFLSQDNRTVMLVYGRENVRNETLSDLYGEAVNSGMDITYKILKSNWFVVSGYDNGTVFYQKTIFLNDQFLTFRIVYPKGQKRLFDSVTATIATSFKRRIAPSANYSQTSAAKRWTTFWASFQKAVRNRDKVTLETTVSKKYFVADGGLMSTLEERNNFIKEIGSKEWRMMDIAIGNGVRVKNDTERTTSGELLIFRFENGRWFWTDSFFHGD